MRRLIHFRMKMILKYRTREPKICEEASGCLPRHDLPFDGLRRTAVKESRADATQIRLLDLLKYAAKIDRKAIYAETNTRDIPGRPSKSI
jgi:hypothetical protein